TVHLAQLSCACNQPRHVGRFLFPYTTLFRSEGPDSFGMESGPHRLARPLLGQVDPTTLFNSEPVHPPLSKCTATIVQPRLDGERDRKSTRLNSSHLSISYAVFCLKKKTNLDP